jgi:hypothetical protein
MTSDKAIANAALQGDVAIEFILMSVSYLSDKLWPINLTVHDNP